jgi:hypothetical protein
MTFRFAAAALLALEAIGIAVLLLAEVGAIIAGDVASLSSALALAVLILVGVAAVAGFAVATARGRSWGRSGGIVVQALILAVAGGALFGEGANAVVAGALALPAVVTGVLLFFAAREAGRSRGDAS